MSVPGLRDWIFSIKTFAAALLALYIGLFMALPRPYWAMATVYICSQPLSGATRSKAIYRLLGTLVGAAMAVALVPNLVDAPEVLVAALAGWTALCLYVSLLDRTPRSYVFMLAGYTAALIGFPAVTTPEQIFDLASARVQEIGIGILCASLVSSLVLPRSVAEAVSERINLWLAEGARFALDALAGSKSAASADHDLVRLAGDAAEIDMLSTHLGYDNTARHDSRRVLAALRLRLIMLMPVVSSIADRMAALRNASASLPGEVESVTLRLRAWIRAQPPSLDLAEQQREAAEAEHLRVAIEAAQPALRPDSGWADLLVANLLIRMRELVDLASDCRILRRAVAAGRAPAAPLVVHPEAGAARRQHRDHLLPLLSAIGVAIAVVAASAVWIATGWPDGSSAPMMAAVACSFFAARDDPAPAIVDFAVWSAVAIVLFGLYLFAILPLVSDFEMAALVLAPAYLTIGLMISMPKTSSKGIALGVNGTTLMALQGTSSSDFTGYANGAIAFLFGMVLAAALTRITRSVGTEWSVRRLMRAAARTLAEAARHRSHGDRAEVAGLMLDRLGLLAPRLAALRQGGELGPREAIAAPRIGLNIVDLRRARAALPIGTRAAVDHVLDGLASHFGQPHSREAAGVLVRIDAALRAILAVEDSAARRDALMGLIGIRRALYPDAPPYRPLDPPARESLAA